MLPPDPATLPIPFDGKLNTSSADPQDTLTTTIRWFTYYSLNYCKFKFIDVWISIDQSPFG